MEATDKQTRLGIVAGVAAFSMWGAFPIYFIVAEGVSAPEMLAHRIVWAVPFGAVIIGLRRQWPAVRAVFANRRTLGLLTVAAAVIAVNWLIYIFAAQNGQVFQASLGYYINPLMLMLVGFAILGERLRRAQFAAVMLAATGVAVLTISGGQFPWIALTLATSFTIYGFIRKQTDVGAMPGLFVETLVLFPLALAWLLTSVAAGTSVFTPEQPGMMLLRVLAGPLTVLPLVFFAVAARRLPLSTIGFLQFIGPTGQFFVGYANGEPLTTPHIVCFLLIWSAAAVFIGDALRNGRRSAPQSA